MSKTCASSEWLVGGGHAGDLIRSIDWSDSPVGPRRDWPSALRTLVQLVVESRFPMALLWGPELVLLYNDAYEGICGDRHPGAMGGSSHDIWPEVWHINEPIFSAVMERGETIYLEDKCFPIDRNGRREDAYFTLCYSPARNQGGAVAGTLVTLQETTTQVAERRRLEQERERALDALENGDACYVLDSQFRYVLVNRAQEESSGKRREQILGRCLWDVWPEAADRKYKFWDVYHRVMRERIPEQFEEHFPPLDLWAEINVFPTAEGGIAAFFRRINDRKKAQAALRASEEKFAKAFHAHVAGVAITRLSDGCYLEVNDRLLELTGFRRDQLIGTSAAALVWKHPEDRAKFVRDAREGNGVAAEYTFLRATGQEWTGLVSARVIQIEEEPVVVSSVIDVTERRHAEEELRRSEEKFAKAFRGNAAAMTITRLEDGTFIDLNDTYTRITGYRPEDLVGISRPIWKRAEDRAAWVRRLRETGSVTGLEARLIKKSGEEWAGLVSAQVVTIGGEETVISSIIDITDRQRARAELQAREADLREAVGRLGEADRRKDEFIAILSHELRNPLAPIRYALPVLQGEKITQRAQRAVDVIGRQVDHLTRLVDDLLDVSRITRGKIELRLEHATLGSIVSAAVEAASPAIAAARHSLDIAVCDEPVWLRVDRARMTQLLTNLLNNSAKYTPRGGRITVEAGCDNGRAFICVRDNGMGIPADALSTVFEMFRQVDRPDKSQGGLGIGLALVKRLVEMHGGSIEASSAGAGQGAEFVVRVPVAEDPTGHPEESAANQPAGTRSLKVLVVDDNADLVEMLAIVVQAAGHDVRKALDGRSALSAARSYRPDVVLLDLGLPVMNGIEVARELRRMQETAHARLVALTGWGQAEDRRQTKEAGFDDHLTKPTDPARLTDMLRLFATTTS